VDTIPDWKFYRAAGCRLPAAWASSRFASLARRMPLCLDMCTRACSCKSVSSHHSWHFASYGQCNESAIVWEPVLNRNKRKHIIEVEIVHLEPNVDRGDSISRVWTFASVSLIVVTPLILGFCVWLPAPV
jgi:hypothetical protein